MEHRSVEEFSVITLELGGFAAALQALRLPFGKETRSEVRFETNNFGMQDELRCLSHFCFNPDDKKLISTLVKRGDEHAKVLRGVVAWTEINAPLYWWKEMDTYRVGAERLSSESSMHIDGRGLNEEELLTFQEEMPSGHMQKRVWTFSYQTLRRIYFQRRSHRLPQWRMFCEWIEALPFAKEFITIEK